ncbi:MAG: hypothetical protein QF440_04525 [Candidatus Thalassarchaeaceae archaeon]|jgi:hypothetical protein|nr:hypothetical protein [Candidatus Thalassarchaeaceae archaeon]
MGFKKKARKSREKSGEENGRKGRKKTATEGEKKCARNDCENWADKSFGGRSIAYDNLLDVWEEDELNGENRRMAICKSCYRKYKKAKKDDESLSW